MENNREIMRQILMKFITGAKLQTSDAFDLLKKGGATISKSQFEEARRRDHKGRAITAYELLILVSEWQKIQRPELHNDQ